MTNRNDSWQVRLAQPLLLIVATAGILLARAMDVPPASTGDFGELSCSQSDCHLGNPVNDGVGSLRILGVPGQYQSGQTYSITVEIDRTNQNRWGFQLSVRAADNSAQAGTLIATNSFLNEITTQDGIQYIHHSESLASTFPGESGPRSWTFDWRAPDGEVGPIRFSAAGNAANNNSSRTGDFIYTTTETSEPPPAANFLTSLFYPRLVSSDGSQTGLDTSESTGIAVANFDSEDATLEFSGFETGGSLLSGPGITNPAALPEPGILNAGGQIPIVDFQVFGSTLPSLNPTGWLKIRSTVNKIVGFFLTFNNELSVLDGADVSNGTLTSFVLPEIEVEGFAQIHVANPGEQVASVDFDLINVNGAMRSSVNRKINPHGTAAPFIQDLFPQVPDIDPSDYVRATSDQGVVPFEFLGKKGIFVHGLNGQDATAGATTLYCPQYVVGGGVFRTTLAVVSLDGAENVTFRFIRDDGTLVGQAQRAILAKGKIYITEQDFFLDNLAEMTQGYVEITSDGPTLSGSVVFGDPGRSTFSTALPLISVLRNAFVFGQVASDVTFFMGVALLNPNDMDANATVEIFDRDGNLIRTKVIVIQANRRVSKLLTQQEYFPDLVGVNLSSGYIVITVDKNIAGFALFGTHDLSVLSAVPPQVVP